MNLMKLRLGFLFTGLYQQFEKYVFYSWVKDGSKSSVTEKSTIYIPVMETILAITIKING